MDAKDFVALALADAWLAEPAGQDFTGRATVLFGQPHPWIPRLARRIKRQFGTTENYDRRTALAQFIRADDGYTTAWSSNAKPRLRQYVFATPQMRLQSAWLATAKLPPLATCGALAEWLGLTTEELAWFADTRGMNRTATGKLNHYQYQWRKKRSGQYRLIESPKERLRAIQRKILTGILNQVPPHDAAHGFRRQRSCLSFTAPHIGKDCVLRIDLSNFFNNITDARVKAVFGALGYPTETARGLAALCTHALPQQVLQQAAACGIALSWVERQTYRTRHLPQGAPTSPALANLCAYGLDVRLSALAAKHGADYTRYADDIAFSVGGAFKSQAADISTFVAVVAQEEGFAVNFRKTRRMPTSQRQQLTGIILNKKPNVRRTDYDALKAILHNCRQGDPVSQNRSRHPDFRAHLLGKINYVKQINPQRGTKLLTLFSEITWPKTQSQTAPEQP